MSSDPVELLPLKNGMSAPDPSVPDIGDMAPMYSSVEAAQSDTQDYRNKQAHTQAHETAKYAHPGPPEPDNEYELVNENQRGAGENPRGYRNNVLYADQFAAQEMKHATLTRSSQRHYKGPSSNGPVKEPKDNCCQSSNFCLWCTLALVFVFVALLAIVAILLVVLVIIQVIPVCNCAATPEEVQSLRSMVESLTLAQNTTRTNVSLLSDRITNFDVAPLVETALDQRVDNGTIIGLNFSAVLRDFEPYTDCETSIERTCPIPADQNLCETVDVKYISSDPARNYTRDARCVRQPLSTDPHSLLTSLVIENNIVFCLCYRIQDATSGTPQPVECGLQITRCRSSRDVPVAIETTSSASRVGN